jgi:hypothetical protein
MTLDQVCARPGAGAALLYLHRWLPQEGAFVLRLAFGKTATSQWLLQAGAELTAFTVLAELGRVAKGTSDPVDFIDRSLLLMRQDGRFEVVRDFLAMQAALHEADARHQAAGRGSLRAAFTGSESYAWALVHFHLALGLPVEATFTNPDGTPYEGSRS